jgi:hypothetical protein
MYICTHVLPTLHYWSIGSKTEYNVIWITALNSFLKFSTLSSNALNKIVKSLLKK